MGKIKEYLYEHRFYLFLGSELAVLFGSLFFSKAEFNLHVQPFLVLLSIIAAINLISKNRAMMWLFIVFLILGAALLSFDVMLEPEKKNRAQHQAILYLVYGILITGNLIRQVWRADHVNRNVIMGLMSGYISLGFVSFYIFLLIEQAYPGAFSGIRDMNNVGPIRPDLLLYYAFVTLLAIGYGDIFPLFPVAQKAAILCGLMGQFYMVIIPTVVLAKYIRQTFNKGASE